MLCSNYCSTDNQQYTRLVVMGTLGEGLSLVYRWEIYLQSYVMEGWKSFLIKAHSNNNVLDVKDSKQKLQLGIIWVSHHDNWWMTELFHDITLGWGAVVEAWRHRPVWASEGRTGAAVAVSAVASSLLYIQVLTALYSRGQTQTIKHKERGREVGLRVC